MILKNSLESKFTQLNLYFILYFYFIFKFSWESKPEKIKRNRLKLPFDMEGLNIPAIFDYNRSLKAGWDKRYLDTHIQLK